MAYPPWSHKLWNLAADDKKQYSAWFGYDWERSYPEKPMLDMYPITYAANVIQKLSNYTVDSTISEANV
ncbi:hypothetical protein DD237_003770 [Peronospora effusa]|uniref:Uncharacterized protein n=1 Tax=Peronospora effusa TaxID=542832 RepID=A0A3R7W787_9STRA|nr:hypothetical protein DD237_003770 [Peronospora effusa]